MYVTLVKLFMQEEKPFLDVLLHPLNELIEQKKQRVQAFFAELIDLSNFKNISLISIFDDQNKIKFSHCVICLSLKHINILFKFFYKNKSNFTQSK